jgi:hypothetical protein
MKTEQPRNAGFILYESPGTISRDTITLESFTGAGILKPGTVLGKLTSGGKYVISPNSGSNGAQTAVAVLAHIADLSIGDVEAAVIDFGAELIGEALIYDTSVDDPTKTAAKITQLRANFIKVR